MVAGAVPDTGLADNQLPPPEVDRVAENGMLAAPRAPSVTCAGAGLVPPLTAWKTTAPGCKVNLGVSPGVPTRKVTKITRCSETLPCTLMLITPVYKPAASPAALAVAVMVPGTAPPAGERFNQLPPLAVTPLAVNVRPEIFDVIRTGIEAGLAGPPAG